MNMMTSFHTAAVGMIGQQEGLDVTANNLANLSTDGYKADRAAFSDLLYTNMKQETGASHLKAGSGSRLWKTDASLDTGGIRQTRGDFDYALPDNRNFFAVKTAEGIRYTRDGHFQKALGSDGLYYLADTEGHYVLDKNGRNIAVTEGQQPQTPGVFTFQNLDGLQKAGDSFFQPTARSGQALVQPDATVKKGFLEYSNVDLSQEFSNMISQQRSYEMDARIVQMSDEVMQTVNNLR